MDIIIKKIEIKKFIPLFVKYYGQVHNESYQRPLSEWEAVAKWRDEAYFFYHNDSIVGGYLRSNSVIAGLFTVPPYNDYKHLLDNLLNSLEDRVYTFYEVPQVYRKFYDERFELISSEVMMYMSPCQSSCKLPSGYHASTINEDDLEEIGFMLHTTFSSSEVFKKVDEVSEFVNSVSSFYKSVDKNSTLYKSTLKVTDENNRIVGVILSMIDAKCPFAYNLAVHPDHQGKGIGKFLLSTLVDGVKDDYDKIRLVVQTNNPAKKMYKKMGFISTSPVKNFKY